MIYTREVGPTTPTRIFRSTIFTAQINLRYSICGTNLHTLTAHQHIFLHRTYWPPNKDGHKSYVNAHKSINKTNNRRFIPTVPGPALQRTALTNGCFTDPHTKRRVNGPNCPTSSTMLYTRAARPTIPAWIFGSTILTAPLHLRFSTCYTILRTRAAYQEIFARRT